VGYGRIHCNDLLSKLAIEFSFFLILNTLHTSMTNNSKEPLILKYQHV
jgi:hypothetical protein